MYSKEESTMEETSLRDYVSLLVNFKDFMSYVSSGWVYLRSLHGRSGISFCCNEEEHFGDSRK